MTALLGLLLGCSGGKAPAEAAGEPLRGYGIYGSATAYFGPLTLLVEAKRYKDAQENPCCFGHFCRSLLIQDFVNIGQVTVFDKQVSSRAFLTSWMFSWAPALLQEYRLVYSVRCA